MASDVTAKGGYLLFHCGFGLLLTRLYEKFTICLIQFALKKDCGYQLEPPQFVLLFDTGYGIGLVSFGSMTYHFKDQNKYILYLYCIF